MILGGVILLGGASVLWALFVSWGDQEACKTGDCISAWWVLAPLLLSGATALTVGIVFERRGRRL
jgi:hypothetical protein